MIQSLALRDFQSIAEAELELGRFTVIVGESDLGKSAVLRALRALAMNQAGSDKIRHGAKSAAVAVQLEDGAVVWTKKGSAAEYRLLGESDPLEFSKMGRTVPPEVDAAVQLSPVVIGDDEFSVNFHHQWEGPFLVQESPGKVAKLLGEISGINTLFLAIQEGRRREQEAKRRQTTKLSDLETVKQQLQAFAGLDERQQRLDAVKKGVQTLLERQQELLAAADAVEDIRRLQERLSALTGRVAAYRKVVRQIGDVEGWRLRRREVDDMARDIEELRRLVDRLGELKGEFAQRQAELDQIEAALAEVTTCPTCGRPMEGHEHESVSTAILGSVLR